MAIEDYIDIYADEDSEPSVRVTCKFCGATDLEWEQVSGPRSKYGQRFKLLEADGSDHQCPPSDADEFEIVE